MTLARKPFVVTTRQAVTRILGSADALPDRSKAAKVLTMVACRLQLFVFELERARYEHIGLGIEQLLERLHEHCQLLSVTSILGGGVQSGKLASSVSRSHERATSLSLRCLVTGYALLAELLMLLRV
jgi:hypothetical protein